MVDRYEIQDPGCQVYEEPDGNLVYYSDYAALEQRVKELEAELGVWENKETFWDKTNKELEAKLSTLRVERDQLVKDNITMGNEAKNAMLGVSAFRAERDRLKARLTEQADEFGRQIQSLHLDVAARDGEIKRLQSQIKRAQEMYPFLRDEEGGGGE